MLFPRNPQRNIAVNDSGVVSNATGSDMNIQKIFGLSMAFAAIGMIGGCAGSGVFAQDNPKVRAFNAARRTDTVKVKANDTVITNGIAQGEASAESELGAGTYTFTTRLAATDELLATNADRLLETKSNYLLVVYNDPAAVDKYSSTLVRENEDTTAGKTELSFVRATQTYCNVDLYIIPPGGTLDNSNKVTLTSVGPDNDVIVTVDPGTYTLKMYAQGTTTDEKYSKAFTFQPDHNEKLIVSASNELDAPVIYDYQER
ncbi:hypothetical protein BH11ARM1_BH11ARM1_14910 [soil metagenome]